MGVNVSAPGCVRRQTCYESCAFQLFEERSCLALDDAFRSVELVFELLHDLRDRPLAVNELPDGVTSADDPEIREVLRAQHHEIPIDDCVYGSECASRYANIFHSEQ